jgi:hypothetical protein
MSCDLEIPIGNFKFLRRKQEEEEEPQQEHQLSQSHSHHYSYPNFGYLCIYQYILPVKVL